MGEGKGDAVLEDKVRGRGRGKLKVLIVLSLLLGFSRRKARFDGRFFSTLFDRGKGGSDFSTLYGFASVPKPAGVDMEGS